VHADEAKTAPTLALERRLLELEDGATDRRQQIPLRLQLRKTAPTWEGLRPLQPPPANFDEARADPGRPGL